MNESATAPTWMDPGLHTQEGHIPLWMKYVTVDEKFPPDRGPMTRAMLVMGEFGRFNISIDVWDRDGGVRGAGIELSREAALALRERLTVWLYPVGGEGSGRE